MEKLSSSGFLEGPILPALTRFSLPILLALILQALYGAVDLWAVGTFCGAADVSAVSTGSQTMLIVTGLVAGLSMGTTVLLGQKIGQNDGRGAARVITTSLWIFLGLAILLSIITVLAAKAIASIMNAPPEAFEKTVHYIRICGAGSIFIVGYNLISAIFRGMGNSKAPLFFVAVACITNIIGDIALIKIFHMGTEGVAIATIAAQAVSVLLSAVMIKRKGLPFPLSRSTIPPDRKTALSVIRLGSPIALQDMCNEISYLILLGFVNTLGVTISAGVGIAEKLVMFMLLIPMSYMQAISAFVAQNSGAGQNERAAKTMWTGLCTAIVLGGTISTFSFFQGDLLSTAFIDDGPVIDASAEFLKATSIECFVLSIAYCFTGYFNGLGKTTFVMAQGLCAIFLVKIPYAWFASSRPEPALFNIGFSTVLAALFTLAACIAYYICRSRKNCTSEGGIAPPSAE